MHIMGAKEKTQYGLFGLIWRLGVAGFLSIGLGAVACYFAVQYIVVTPEESAPDLLTMELVEAVEKASGKGFSVQIEKNESTDLVEEGRVLSQRPTPGTIVKVGSTIRLTVASAP